MSPYADNAFSAETSALTPKKKKSLSRIISLFGIGVMQSFQMQ